jgi:hypothetical protein
MASGWIGLWLDTANYATLRNNVLFDAPFLRRGEASVSPRNSRRTALHLQALGPMSAVVLQKKGPLNCGPFSMHRCNRTPYTCCRSD